MKKEKRKKKSLETSAGFLLEPSQDLRVPFSEKLPVGYFRCVVL